VVVTTLVLVDVVAGVAATDGVVAAGDGAAAVEVVAVAADAVEPEEVVGLPWADAIPQAVPRSPPTDSRAAAIRLRRAGWRRRTVPRSRGSGVAGIVGSFPSGGIVPCPKDRDAFSQGSGKGHRASTEFTVEPHSTL
jgi:hypothetical protein